MFSAIAPSIAQIGVTAIVAGVWAYLSIKKEQLVEIPVPIIVALCAAWGLKVIPGMLGGG